MDIRFVLEKNPEIAARLNKFVQDIHVEKHPDIFNPYNYDTVLAGISKMLENDNIYCIIAYMKDDPVGYTILVQRNYPEPVFKKGHSSIYIDQICIIKEFQNRGFGTRIMEFIKSFCRDKGINRIELGVWADNEPARGFFTKCGFTDYLHNMKVDL